MASVNVGDQPAGLASLPSAPAGIPEREEQRTLHAVRLFDFGELFRRRFANQSFGEQRMRRLRLTDPDSQSTAGGRAARRALLMVPDDGAADALVVGWVDVVRKVAEVRTYESMSQYTEERFGRVIDLSIEAYAEMYFELARVLKGEGIQLTFLASSPPVVAAAHPPGMNGVVLWGIGLLTGMCLGYALSAA